MDKQKKSERNKERNKREKRNKKRLFDQRNTMTEQNLKFELLSFLKIKVT